MGFLSRLAGLLDRAAGTLFTGSRPRLSSPGRARVPKEPTAPRTSAIAARIAATIGGRRVAGLADTGGLATVQAGVGTARSATQTVGRISGAGDALGIGDVPGAAQAGQVVGTLGTVVAAETAFVGAGLALVDAIAGPSPWDRLTPAQQQLYISETRPGHVPNIALLIEAGVMGEGDGSKLLQNSEGDYVRVGGVGITAGAQRASRAYLDDSGMDP